MFNAYTDGSCYPTNPGNKGLCCFAITDENDNIYETCVKVIKKKVSSIYMELKALYICMQHINKKYKKHAFDIYTDCSYVHGVYNDLMKSRVYTKEWLIIKRIKNIHKHQINVYWVQGHKNNNGNIYVDKTMRHIHQLLHHIEEKKIT